MPSNDQENRWEEVELFNRWNFLTGSLWPSSTRHSPVLHFHTCRQRHCSSSQWLTLTFKVSWNWFAKHIAFKYWFWFKVINFLSTTVYYPFLQNFNVHAAAHNHQLLNSPPDTHILSAYHQRHNESMSPVMTQCLKLLKLTQQLQQKFVSMWRNY